MKKKIKVKKKHFVSPPPLVDLRQACFSTPSGFKECAFLKDDFFSFLFF